MSCVLTQILVNHPRAPCEPKAFVRWLLLTPTAMIQLSVPHYFLGLLSEVLMEEGKEEGFFSCVLASDL